MSWEEQFDTYDNSKENIIIFSLIEKYGFDNPMLDEMLIKSLSIFETIRNKFNLVFLNPYNKENKKILRNHFDGTIYFTDHVDLVDFNYNVKYFYIYDTNTGIYNLNHFGTIEDEKDDYDHYISIKDFYFQNYEFFESKHEWFDDEYLNKEYKLSIKYRNIYRILDKLFLTTFRYTKKFQFLSDPVDYKFKNCTILTPDSKVITGWEYFPAYQYFFFMKRSLFNNFENKKYALIFGNTSESIYRNELIERYLYPIYSKKRNDNNYRMYLKNFVSGDHQINNYIDHNQFFDELNQSKVGLSINTYSKDIISMNKFSMFLSNNVIPIFTIGSDDRSQYFPTHIRQIIEFNNYHDILKFVENLNDEKFHEIMGLLKEYTKELFDYNYYYNLMINLFI